MLNLMGLLQGEDVVRLVVVALGCFLIYASYKKCDKNNKKVKVIIRLLAAVALATILKAFYKGNFALSGLDYFSNAAIVVILHILVIAATTQLGANCSKLPKKHHKSIQSSESCKSSKSCKSSHSSHSSHSCATSSGWSCSSSSSCSTTTPCSCSTTESFDCKPCDKKVCDKQECNKKACDKKACDKKSKKSCKKGHSSSSSSSSSSTSSSDSCSW